MDNKKPETKKEIQVVTGNGKDLDISTVYEHIKSKDSQSHNNTNNKKGAIVIPKRTPKKN